MSSWETWLDLNSFCQRWTMNTSTLSDKLSDSCHIDVGNECFKKKIQTCMTCYQFAGNAFLLSSAAQCSPLWCLLLLASTPTWLWMDLWHHAHRELWGVRSAAGSFTLMQLKEEISANSEPDRSVLTVSISATPTIYPTIKTGGALIYLRKCL